VLLAKGSEKTAIENQHDIFAAEKISEPHRAIVEIIQNEIRRWRVELDSGQTCLLARVECCRKQSLHFSNFLLIYVKETWSAKQVRSPQKLLYEN